MPPQTTPSCLLQVAEQLFRPLVFQLVHWFTGNTQYESPDTIALLEAFLVRVELSHHSNTYVHLCTVRNGWSFSSHLSIPSFPAHPPSPILSCPLLLPLPLPPLSLPPSPLHW